MKTRNIAAIVGAIALGAVMAGPASASALHGCTSNTGCAETNGNTLLGSSTEFGFTYSGSSSETGTFSLDILLANNYTAPASFSVTGIGNPGGTATLVGEWTSGNLADFLNISADPTNPIGAYAGTGTIDATLDPAATGFYVYQLALTDFTLPSQGSGAVMQFDTVSGLGVGSYILGFLADSADCGSGDGNKDKECATANSGALVVNTSTVPEPGSLALFASALALLGLFVQRRRRSPKA